VVTFASEEPAASIFKGEFSSLDGGGSRILWTVGTYLHNYMISHPREQLSSD
jgi:hypothetical protein